MPRQRVQLAVPVEELAARYRACVELGTWKAEPGGFDAEKLTVWGGRLFDNEADARRAFG